MASNEYPLRVMLDANVLIAGIRVPRWPYEVLQHALAKDYVPVLSVQVIREARKHLSGPRQGQALEYFLAQSGYEEAPTPSLEEIEINRNLVRSLKDVPIALSAIRAKVSYFVTNDKDLTEDEGLKAKLNILLPAVFLRDVMGWTSEQLEAIRYRQWSDVVPDLSL
jgi:predicted nucleic acid-binding protein